MDTDLLTHSAESLSEAIGQDDYIDREAAVVEPETLKWEINFILMVTLNVGDPLIQKNKKFQSYNTPTHPHSPINVV